MVSPSTESLSSVSGSEIDAVPASSKVNVPYPTAGCSAFRSMNAVDGADARLLGAGADDPALRVA